MCVVQSAEPMPNYNYEVSWVFSGILVTFECLWAQTVIAIQQIFCIHAGKYY